MELLTQFVYFVAVLKNLHQPQKVLLNIIFVDVITQIERTVLGARNHVIMMRR
jgi:hypothetical protein